MKPLLLSVALVLSSFTAASAMGVLELPTLTFPQPTSPSQDCTTPLRVCE